MIANKLSQDHTSINELQRATIICDIADLARTGYVSQVTVMPALILELRCLQLSLFFCKIIARKS